MLFGYLVPGDKSKAAYDWSMFKRKHWYALYGVQPIARSLINSGNQKEARKY